MATVPLFDQSAPSAAISENAAIIARERQKSLMLRAWIVSGLFFMALPGNVVGIFKPDGDQCASRARHIAGRMDGRTRPRADVRLDRQFHSWHRLLFTTRAWTLGHSSASFLLPLWTSGVAMRWFANIYGWHWRTLLPVSAGFELVAVILFLYAASHHKRRHQLRKTGRRLRWNSGWFPS